MSANGLYSPAIVRDAQGSDLLKSSVAREPRSSQFAAIENPLRMHFLEEQELNPPHRCQPLFARAVRINLPTLFSPPRTARIHPLIPVISFTRIDCFFSVITVQQLKTITSLNRSPFYMI